jgi:hypothetical protein
MAQSVHDALQPSFLGVFRDALEFPVCEVQKIVIAQGCFDESLQGLDEHRDIPLKALVFDDVEFPSGFAFRPGITDVTDKGVRDVDVWIFRKKKDGCVLVENPPIPASSETACEG